jgi:flagellar hook-associated protein 3 FlgL
MMRVTFNGSFTNGTAEITRAAAALAEAQRRVSSGRRINAPSDDPSGSESAIIDRTTMATMDAYTATSNAAVSRLSVADAVLSDVVNQITAAKTTALGARGTTQTIAQREAAREELLSIRDALLSDINAQFHGTYLFSGSKATTAPFAASGGAFSPYQGDGSQVSVDVGLGRTVSISFSGGDIFQGSDSQHLLDTLTNLAASVAAGDNVAIGQGLDALGRAFDRATTAQSTVGSNLRVIDTSRPQIDATRRAALTRVSAVEDANLPEALSDLSRSQAALQAALQSLSTVGRLTLMDYLK